MTMNDKRIFFDKPIDNKRIIFDKPIDDFAFDNYTPKRITARNGETVSNNHFFKVCDMFFAGISNLYVDITDEDFCEIGRAEQSDETKRENDYYAFLEDCYNIYHRVREKMTEDEWTEIFAETENIKSELKENEPLECPHILSFDYEEYCDWIKKCAALDYFLGLLYGFKGEIVKSSYHFLRASKRNTPVSHIMIDNLFACYIDFILERLPSYATKTYYREDVYGFSPRKPFGEKYGNHENRELTEKAIKYCEFTNGNFFACCADTERDIGFFKRKAKLTLERSAAYPNPMDVYDTFVLTSDYNVYKARVFAYEYTCYFDIEEIYPPQSVFNKLDADLRTMLPIIKE